MRLTHNFRFALLLLIASLGLGAMPAAAQPGSFPAYKMYVPPLLRGNTYSLGVAINDRNEAVFHESSTDHFFPTRSVYWNPRRGSMPLAFAGQDAYVRATDINNKGDIVGTFATNYIFGSFKWNPDGKPFIFINTGLPYDYYFNGLNDFGDIVGHAMNEGPAVPFVRPNGKDAKILPGFNGEWSSAVAVNNNGAVTGFRMFSEGELGVLRSFLWLKGRRVDIPGLGGQITYPEAVNNRSQVVGESLNQEGNYHAFLWDFRQGTLDLGTLGGPYSFALGLNDKAQVVGWSSVDGEESSQAFVWFNNRMHNLNSLVLPSPESRRFRLIEARGINNGGVIIGTGVSEDGETRAVILFPVPRLY